MVKTKKIHYAWVVLAGVTLMYFTITGLACNNFPVYNPFIMNLYGYSKTEVSLIGSMRSLSATAAVMCCPRFYRRFSLRNGMLLSGLGMAAGYVVYGLARSYPVYLAGSLLSGFSYGLGSMVPVAMLLGKWFDSKRTLALSIVSASSGLATVGVPSVITKMIQTRGIHQSFIAEAAAFAVLFGIAWLLVRNDPVQMGLSAYREEGMKDKKTAEEEDKRIPYLPERWWTVLAVCILAATSAASCYTNLSMLSATSGYSAETIAVVISIAGAALMAGKLLFGVVATAIGLKKASTLFGSFTVLGLILCCLLTESVVFLYAGTALLGLSLSMLTVGSVAWIQDWAPAEERTDRIKVFQTVYNAGCLILGILAGIAADLAGGSYIPFFLFAAAYALFFVLLIRKTYSKVRRR